MRNTQFILKSTVAAVIAVLASPQFAIAADEKQVIETKKIEVISTTPLQGVGLPLEQIPANVQSAKGEAIEQQGSLSIADFMSQNLIGVNVNETQNNPYQPDVNFRGFTASPLLGTPQGLSVFVDGVRVNEPFGDVVNWDLIPVNSLAGMSLIPGSNPVFGLNTLGGALSLQTKSGRTNPGGAIEAYTGSWGRKAGSAEFGGVSKDGSIDYFISGNVFSEDGWRDASPSDVNQVFGKVGWQDEKNEISLSITGADNKLIGNGLLPQDFIENLGRESIFTKPDITKNDLIFLNLTGSHWFNDNTQFSGNIYLRDAHTSTYNGDLNDDYDDGIALDNDPTSPTFNPNGAINTTKSTRKGAGFTGQVTFNQDLFGRKNQFIVGGGYDYGHTEFSQKSQLAALTASRGVTGLGVFNDDSEVNLRGINRTWSAFATDTHSLNEMWSLTLSGRYNTTTVDNSDFLIPTGIDSLSGRHTFNRFNPAVGLSFTPNKDLTAYVSYNEGSRAPTAIELGCANPNNTCKLPNAFAGDPPLDQVVAKTIETGLRGNLSNSLSWSAAVFRTENHNDILFVASDAVSGEGYFNNFGKTRRQGLELGVNGKAERFTWGVGYSYVDATYQSSESIVSANNSTADVNGVIQIKPGDRIPGIPKHQLKLRGNFAVTPAWSVGANVVAFSDQYSRGNENNDHEGDGAKVKGYAVVNMDTRYRFGKGWQVFGRLNNVFDRDYNTSGLLGETLFNANGTFSGTESEQAFYAPGAPRAGWIGVRYEFGKPKATAYDLD
ncbi:MAG TPA: TonB-dependent receptor [Methylotenera sp.]|nr:TonB-dependent receptor [Methylotenera sp.]